jgi:uncharacterized protein DUF6064
MSRSTHGRPLERDTHSNGRRPEPLDEKTVTLPFTTEAFFGVFARYNVEVWPMPVVLTLLGAATVGLILRSSRFSDRLTAGVLSFLWLWMGLAYHLAFFSAINPAAFVFSALFVLEGLLLARSGLLRGALRFRLAVRWRSWLALSLITYGLFVYPLLGRILGHRYPAAPTFGLPCPTTLFTLGVLLTVRRCPLHLMLIPLAWCLVGSVAAWRLGVPEDYGLTVAGLLVPLALARDRAGAGHPARLAA